MQTLKLTFTVCALTLALTATAHAQGDNQANAGDGIQPFYTYSVPKLKQLVDETSKPGYDDRVAITCTGHAVVITAQKEGMPQALFLFGQVRPLDAVLSASPVPATVQPQAAAFTLDSLKQAIQELDQQPARATDTVQAEIKNGGLRLYTDNKRTSVAVWSFNAYRLNASDQGVFDQGVRMPLSELKAQLTHAGQAKQTNVELSSKDGQVTVTPTSARPDGAHSGNAIVRLDDINGLVQDLGDDSRPVEFTFAAVSNDAVTFAIQGQNPAVATVYTVNYQED